MKALFIVTQTNDVVNHVAAWNSIAPEPATVEVFNYQGVQNCWRFDLAAKEAKPDVIFYIGACSGTGNPKPSTLRGLNASRLIHQHWKNLSGSSVLPTGLPTVPLPGSARSPSST